MKFSKKTKISSEIPTASMPDIIFMLLVFFMVTTVLKEYSGLPVNLPKAKRIEKLKSKRHTVQVWVSKEGLISIKSPIARAIIGKLVGDEVEVSAPSGKLFYEVVSVKYED